MTSLIAECGKSGVAETLVGEYGMNLMCAIVFVLAEQCILIRKYAIVVLSELSQFANKVSWSQDEMLRHRLIRNVKQFEAKCIEMKHDQYHRFGDFSQLKLNAAGHIV